MRRIINTIIFAGAACVGLASCAKGDGAQPQIKIYEQGFNGITRADVGGNPEHADTYLAMSFNKTNAQLTANIAGNRGSYAYDFNSDYNVGSLVPVFVSSTTYKTTLDGDGKLIKSGDHGMHLIQGDYYVSIIHPGVPSYQANLELGFLAVFNRTDKIFASSPLDKNGDGTADDPFEIKVETNRQQHDVNGVVMHPVMSAIKTYVYSHFYAESDVAHTTPLSVDFTIEEIKLINAGVNGWYNPLQGIVYPNYNYKNKWIYSKDVPADIATENEEALTAVVSNETFPNRDGETVTAKFKVDNVSVFPSDYRGEEKGGSPYVIPMTLYVKLKDNNGLFNKSSIPISIEIKRNKLYKFYINVTSEQIEIAYTMSDWNYQTDSYTDINDLPTNYAIINIDWTTSGNWDNGGGGSQEIN